MVITTGVYINPSNAKIARNFGFQKKIQRVELVCLLRFHLFFRLISYNFDLKLIFDQAGYCSNEQLKKHLCDSSDLVRFQFKDVLTENQI